MAKLAFSIAGAARTAGVKETTIISAIKGNHLIARRVEEDKAIILATDIQKWLETLDRY